jgi:hypothetical protein
MAYISHTKSGADASGDTWLYGGAWFARLEYWDSHHHSDRLHFPEHVLALLTNLPVLSVRMVACTMVVSFHQ